jgi:hypothetical protein
MKTPLIQCAIAITMFGWIGIQINFGMGAACCAPTCHHGIVFTYIPVFAMGMGRTTS